MTERDYALSLANEHPDQYTFQDYDDGTWYLVTDDGYVATRGGPEVVW